MRCQYKKSQMKKDIEKESENGEEEEVRPVLLAGNFRCPIPLELSPLIVANPYFFSRSQAASVHGSDSGPPSFQTGTSQASAQVAARSGGKSKKPEDGDDYSSSDSSDEESDSSDDEVSEEGEREDEEVSE